MPPPPNASKYVERPELSLVSGRNTKLCSRFEDSLPVFYKTKSTPTIWSHNHTPFYLTKWFENIGLHKNLHMDDYSSFIRNCQILEETKMSISEQMDG